MREKDEAIVGWNADGSMTVTWRKMKYNNIAELAAAYNSGELTEATPLFLDNDYAEVFDEDKDEVVFEGDPREMFLEVLKLVGIPYQYA